MHGCPHTSGITKRNLHAKHNVNYASDIYLSITERWEAGKICELEIKGLDREAATFTLSAEK
jgi:hypothetical protein